MKTEFQSGGATAIRPVEVHADSEPSQRPHSFSGWIPSTTMLLMTLGARNKLSGKAGVPDPGSKPRLALVQEMKPYSPPAAIMVSPLYAKLTMLVEAVSLDCSDGSYSLGPMSRPLPDLLENICSAECDFGVSTPEDAC